MLLAACGGGEGPEIKIGFSSQALVSGVQTIRIAFHQQSRTCQAIRSSPPTVKGVYNFPLNLDAMQQSDGGSTELNNIRAGTYTVSVFGGSPAGPVAFGCQPSVVIEDGVQAQISLTLAPLP